MALLNDCSKCCSWRMGVSYYDFCSRCAAVNVTAQLVAWNATQAPTVSHNSVYTIAPLGSKQFLSFDFKDTLAEAGISANDISKYFMHLTVSVAPPCPSCSYKGYQTLMHQHHQLCLTHDSHHRFRCSSLSALLPSFSIQGA